MDEGVGDARKQSYAKAEVTQAHTNFETWNQLHFQPYLRDQVYLDKRTASFAAVIDPADKDTCPETFRMSDAFSRFGMVDDRLELLRVEQAQTIASRAGVTESALLELVGKHEAGTLTADEADKLVAILEEWEKNSWIKPVWAAFYQDHADCLETASDWAEQLRDRLGLYHLDPIRKPTKELPVLVFKYPVSALPQVRGQRGVKPLAVPTVLDGELSEAFCPAPVGQPCGFVVNLAGDVPVLREVLHPPISYKLEYLYRSGWVRRPVPADLSAARGYHLTWICTEKGPEDYARATDSDLL